MLTPLLYKGGDVKMTPNFNPRNSSGKRLTADAQTSREMDILQRDRFELLNAYIDGEVTAAERKQVQEWLATDPQVQRLYSRLVKLRQGIQTIPIPVSDQPADKMVQQVFAAIDRRKTRRNVVWGGAATIAALFIGAFSGIVPGSRSLSPQLAQSPNPAPAVAPAPLMVALNRPVVEIPKAAVAAPEPSMNPLVER